MAAVIGTVGIVTVFIVYAAGLIHPLLRLAVSIWLISTTIAVKGLGDAAMLVFQQLAAGDLSKARQYVGYIVGRDTHHLDEPEVSRAAVETVAENMVDAVVSPICYALLGGPCLALIYRAVNTLDSMVGYKSEMYRHFGWASARLDDVLNYLPARLTGLLLALLAAVGRGLSAAEAWSAMCRDARKHPSPNSGIPEAAVAGALGIQLGGCNSYKGIISERARMGLPKRALEAADIPRTCQLLNRLAWLLMGLLGAMEVVRWWWL